jgi:hypothetical protein
MFASTVWFVKDTSAKVVLSKDTVGAVPEGLKDAPLTEICWVELLTTALRIIGAVAPQAGRTRNTEAVRNDVRRDWSGTLKSSVL